MNDQGDLSGGSRQAILVLAALIFFPSAGDALAAEPAVEFVNDAPLNYELKRLRADNGITVEVHNAGRRVEKVTARVVDLEPKKAKRVPAAAGLFAPEGTEARVQPAKDKAITVRLAGTQDPAAGEYTGAIVLVVTGEPIARRALTVSVPAGDPPPLSGATLAPQGLTDTTLAATNFAPSVLSPLGPTLFVLAAVLAVALSIWWGWLGERANPLLWRIGGVALGVALLAAALALKTFGETTAGPAWLAATLVSGCALIALWGRIRALPLGGLVQALAGLGVLALALVATTRTSFGDDLAGQPALHAVEAKTLPTNSKVAAGRVGVVSDTEGGIAELRVTEGRLGVAGLRRAGAYTGQLDLNGTADKGDAKAAVNVRDWWPWALLAVGGGVLLGLALRRWYERTRPRELLRLKALRLWKRLTDAHLRPGARAGFIPSQRVWTRLKEVERRLAEDDETTAAETELTAVAAYVKRAEALRNRLAALETLAAAFEQQWDGERFDVGRDQVRALVATDELLQRDIDSEEEDEDSKILEDVESEAKVTRDLLEAVWEAHNFILGAVHDVERMAMLTDDPDTKKALDDARANLRKLGRTVLLSNTTDGIAEARGKALEELDNLPATADEEVSAGRLTDDVAEEFELLRRVERDVHKGFEIRLEPLPAEEAPPPRTVRIELEVRAPVTTAPDEGNVDDLFLLRAVVEEPQGALAEVEWVFDEDPKRVRQPVPPGGVTPWIERHYTTAGQHEVKLLGPSEPPLATHTIKVTGPSRIEAEERSFAGRDKRWALLAGALTVASGLLALYLPDASWGSNEDYLKALLWGGVVGEGVALVAAIVARAFPTAK